MNPNDPVILVTSNTDSLPSPNSTGNVGPILVNGGIAVAVIIALSYFTKVQFNAIADCIKKLNKQ